MNQQKSQEKTIKKQEERLEKRVLELERQRDDAKDKLRERTQEYYAAASELEEERGKNKKLTAQVNRDFENSSIPSSGQKPGKKKIPNSRENTDRKPGGQPVHNGHGRKKHVPTQLYEIPAPAKYTDSPDFYETGKTICKQKVCIHLDVHVTRVYHKRIP